MQQYTVTGMTCAACVARVEKAVLKVPGVTDCSVSLLMNAMSVEGSVSEAEIIKAVTDAGYQAKVKGTSDQRTHGNYSDHSNHRDDNLQHNDDGTAEKKDYSRVEHHENRYAAELDALADHETPLIMKRLASSVCVLVLLMYFSMGHHMLGLPLPAFFEGNPLAIGLMQMILAAIVMVINQRFFISGFKSALHLAPNMDTLVAMGSAVSFIYSTVVLFQMTAAMGSAEVGTAITDGAGTLMSGTTTVMTEKAMALMNDLYFEASAMILTLITIGKMLEARSKGKTTDALKSLMKLAPQTATVVREGIEVQISVSEVRPGDIFVVRPGETIPVDGVVLEGGSAVNEAALTGESMPVDKTAGDNISAATINTSGYLRCRATRVGEDTTLSQIIRMVSDAASTKAPIAKTADRVAGVFVPAVLLISAVTFTIWILMGETVAQALSYAISVLVISCPCSLGLATPVAIMVGNGIGAKNGILFKTASAIETTGSIQIVALDKTGTITTGEPVVTDVVPLGDETKESLMALSYALEKKSEHPLAKAIVTHYENQFLLWSGRVDGRSVLLSKDSSDVVNSKHIEVTDFKSHPGCGLSGELAGEKVYAGKLEFVKNAAAISVDVRKTAEELADQGKTALYFVRGGRLAGLIAVADAMKEDAFSAIEELKNQGIRVVMLTGDHERTAKAIAAKSGVDCVIAGVLPEGKEAVIRRLKTLGRVAMVGDGINDAPALTRADIGMAIGAGTDVAIDAAEVVLMKSGLKDVPAAIRLSRATMKNIRENLFWAFFYNSIGIPLAAGVFAGITGWRLNPMFGAAAMSLSSFCVVSNALRLNLKKIHDASKDHKSSRTVDLKVLLNEIETIKEENKMTKTMKIEGMMCMHCEARVKKTLLAIEGVEEAVVSHEAGTAVLTLSKDVTDEVLKTAVEAQDYPVLGIE